jgi:hypothetical protein
MAKLPLLFFIGLTCLSAAVPEGSVPTFNRDVAPILQDHCQSCHRAGEVAPMSLITYKEVRPFAAAIKEAVSLRKMPPWFADPHYGTFSNDRRLSQHDIDTLVNWAKSGATEGDPKDLPPPKHFLQGWNIRKPDMVLQMPAAFPVPETGVLEYQYILVPGNFEKDVWVQMAEVRPGNRAVLHHVIAFVRPPGSKWLASLQPGVPYVPRKDETEMGNSQFLVGYAPGVPAMMLAPGRAKLIKAGSDIVLQMHYTTNGHAGTDRTSVGLSLVDPAEVKERVLTVAAATRDFSIPPNDPNYQVDAEIKFASDIKIVEMLPHMHLRGKDFEYKAIYPDGTSQTLLRVPHYSFSWQLAYIPENDIIVPKGTVIHGTAHYDNSANNPANPDPTKTVTYGDQSWEEMMFGFFDIAVAKDMDLRNLFPKPKEEATTTAAMPKRGTN